MGLGSTKLQSPFTSRLGKGGLGSRGLRGLGSFAPPSTAYHFDASNSQHVSTALDGSIPATTDGDRVQNFNGLTGTGVSRPTFRTGANGLNGLPIVEFDGSANVLQNSDLLGGINTTEWSMFAVFRFTGGINLAGGFGVGDSSTFGEYGQWQSEGGFVGLEFELATGKVSSARAIGIVGQGGSVNDLLLQSTTDFRTGYFLWETRVKAQQGTLRVDGVIEAGPDGMSSAAATHPLYMRMGASGTFQLTPGSPLNTPTFFGQIDIAELLFYNTDQTDLVSEQINSYLHDKWLPASPFVYMP